MRLGQRDVGRRSVHPERLGAQPRQTLGKQARAAPYVEHLEPFQPLSALQLPICIGAPAVPPRGLLELLPKERQAGRVHLVQERQLTVLVPPLS